MELSLVRNEVEPGLLFANKFKSFPVVNSTCFWLSENYNKIKETNFVTKCTCSLAESTLKNSIYLASPLMSKFKEQMTVLDSMACSQLDKLEQAFPIIKSDTDTIVSQSRQLLNKTVQPAVVRYVTFRASTEDKCKTVRSYYANANTTALAYKFLDASQSFIENYLIYSEMRSGASTADYVKYYLAHKSEMAYASTNLENMVKRIRVLTYVLFCSLEANLLKQANESLRVLKSHFMSLFRVIDSYDSLKKGVVFKLQDKFHVTKDKIDLYKEYLDVLSKQFTVQDGRSLQHVHSLEERTKIIIRRSLGNILTAFHLVYSKFHNIQPIVQSGSNTLRIYASDLYQIYSKHDGSFNEMLVETILREVRECLVKTHGSLNIFLKNFNNSTVISWFVPNFETFGILDDECEEFEIDRKISGQNLTGDDSESEINNVGAASVATVDTNSSPSFTSRRSTSTDNTLNGGAQKRTQTWS